MSLSLISTILLCVVILSLFIVLTYEQMKKKKYDKIRKRVAVTGMVLACFWAWANLANAMTVTDPGSYGYYAQQLAKMQAQLKTATDSYNTAMDQLKTLNEAKKIATDTYNKAMEIRDNLQGVYNQGKAAYDKINKITKNIENVKNSFSGSGSDILSIINGVGEYTDESAMLDDIFGDPRSADYAPWKILNQKYEMRQKGLKNALEKSGKTLDSIADKYATLEESASQVGNTENVKEALALTNTLLTQLVQINIEQLALQAQLGTAESLMDFSGVKDGELKRVEDEKKANLTKYEKAKADYLAPYEEMENEGLDPDNPTPEALKQMRQNLRHNRGAK